MNDVSGKTIRAYRERLLLNQRNFAAKLDVTQGLISQVESGYSKVSKKLLRALWGRSDDGVFEIPFEQFLRRGGMNTEPLKAEFGAVTPIPVEGWRSRPNLRDPPDPNIKDWIWIPGLTNGMRAIRFDDPPPIIAPYSLVVFRTVDWSDLAGEQIVLLQVRSKYAPKGLEGGIGYVGRAIVTRQHGKMRCQFERSPIAGPIVEVPKGSIEVLMTCHFRGRYGAV